MRISILSCLIISFITPSWARLSKPFIESTGHPPKIEWYRKYPGFARSIIEDSEKSFIIAGKKSLNEKKPYLFLIKTDTKGNKIWMRNYYIDKADISMDQHVAVKKTLDKGYLISEGFGESHDGKIRILKTDSTGVLCWKHEFSGFLWVVNQKPDSNYIIVFSTPDIYEFIELDNNGAIISKQIYENQYYHYANSFAKTPDGSYLILGNMLLEWGIFCLRKIDGSGKTVWIRKSKELLEDLWNTQGEAKSISLTSEDEYLILSFKKLVSETRYDFDIFLTKMETLGNILFSRELGGINYDDRGYSVSTLKDGGYLIVGTTEAFYSRYINIPTFIDDILYVPSIRIRFISIVLKWLGYGFFRDIYVIRTDEAGNEIWSKRFGKIGENNTFYVNQTCICPPPPPWEDFSHIITSDGGIVIIGYSGSIYDANLSDNFHLIKLKPEKVPPSPH